MSQKYYEYGRKLILSRLKNAHRLLAQTRPEQTHLRQRLAARIGYERVELAKWDDLYKTEAEEPLVAPMDTPHFQESARQVDCIA